MQRELLDTYPEPNLRVYAIWFNMMGGDSRSKWPANLLTDARVIHRWDEPKAVGLWFAPRMAAIRTQMAADSAWSGGDVLWDAYLLYGADAKWTDAPSNVVRWGRTIVAGLETLREDFSTLLHMRASAR